MLTITTNSDTTAIVTASFCIDLNFAIIMDMLKSF